MEFSQDGQQFILHGVHAKKVKVLGGAPSAVLGGAPSAKLLNNVVKLRLLQVRDMSFKTIQGEVVD